MKKIRKILCVVGIAILRINAFCDVAITDVTAQQRYPWNGKVDISFTVSNADADDHVLLVNAVDHATGITNVATHVVGDIACQNGFHHIVWDMCADGFSYVSTNVSFGVAYKVSPRYCVIDLTAGSSASAFPVSYLDDVPVGGWPNEYKTAKLVLRRLPAGSFPMGGHATDYPGARDFGHHNVTLSKGFWIGVFELTQRQYTLITGYASSTTLPGENRPVSLSYNDIRGEERGSQWPISSDVDEESFLGILRKKIALEIDLPTEAQWEYACRAGTTTGLNSGKNLSASKTCVEMNEVGICYWNGGEHSYHVAVGSYLPNAWGLYDMHGNVFEWCLDWSEGWKYDEIRDDETDPVGPLAGTQRITRGGSFLTDAATCSSAYRRAHSSCEGGGDKGFRLCSSSTLPDFEALYIGSETVSGWSKEVSVDLSQGVRNALRHEVISYSTCWDVDVPGERAVISVDGKIVCDKIGSGMFVWAPDMGGVHTLTHKIFDGDGIQIGDTLTAEYEVDPKMPAINPASGAIFGDSLTISMGCETADAIIRYTTDGTMPTKYSSAYKKFRIYHKATVKAIAFLEDGMPSEMAVAEYAKGLCATPIIDAAETFTGSKNKVTISCATDGASIYYTLDGSEPTAESVRYEKPFCVTDTCTVRAIALKDEFFDSDEATLSIVRVWSIGETMGKCDHAFETSGDLGFIRTNDVTAALGESMRSGAIGDGQKSILSATVVGPGTLTFRWRTSCEEDELHKWDRAEFVVDGKVKKVLDGITDWQAVTNKITGDREHTVIWRYVKDAEEKEGEDCLWVSEYVWTSDYTETQTTSVPVPYDWLTKKCCDVVDEYDSYESVAKQKALNKRLTVEQCYVAGVDPESATNDFTTTITMVDGLPNITWNPDLETERTYKVWGSTNLVNGGEWECPTNALHRFFKVTVEMP